MSIERPPSAVSIQGNVRQRLQDVNARAYVVENEFKASEIKPRTVTNNSNFKKFNQNQIEVRKNK